jgi:AAHS family benzoate transporter-like MFS transporter
LPAPWRLRNAPSPTPAVDAAIHNPVAADGGPAGIGDPAAAGGPAGGLDQPLHLYRWFDPAILVTAALAAAAGFAQFGVSSSLADVARTFGKPSPSGSSIAAEVGLSFTVLGVGLGIIRLAALGSLPLAGLADRVGRRRIMVACTTLGLAVSAAAALSPGYWWFVALFALSRPLLAGTNTVSGVIAAEETRSGDRAKAIALVTAGWGAGSGLIAVIRGVAGTALSWRGLFALLVIPLAAMPLLSRRLKEPERFQRARRAAAAGGSAPAGRVLARPPAALRSRLWIITALIAMLGFVTGPANALLFVYSESVLHLAKLVTAAMVASAGVLGLVGLVVGRWTADHLGRRVTAGVTQATIAAAAILTYSGTASAEITGYLLAIFAASMFAPAIGALAAELFPTSIRATVAGWMGVAGVVGAVSGLVLFGVLVTALENFLVAAAIVALPVLAMCPLYARLPETMGMELEESAPD